MRLPRIRTKRSMTVLSSSKMTTLGDLGVGARKGTELFGEKAVFGMTVSNGSPHVSGSETRECGMCSTAVVNRGVLDCCNDWFCFACIDDWATVTNLCPLCKARFRFITCLPVGQGNSREGDLSAGFAKRVDGPNEDDSSHPFSFPSYFIDEEAVLCLEGDACRVRAGLVSQRDEGEIAADTSVACDLCDCWYHAGCVDFDPDQPSFYCPRCWKTHVEANSSFDISSWPQVPPDARQSLLGRSLSSGSEVSNRNGTNRGNTSVDKGESAVSISMRRIPVQNSLPTGPIEENGPMWSPIREPVKPTYNHGRNWSPIRDPSDAFRKEQWSPTPGSALHGDEGDEDGLWSPTPEAERFSRTASEEQASLSLLLSAKCSQEGSVSTKIAPEVLTRRVSFAPEQSPNAAKFHASSIEQTDIGSLASLMNQGCGRHASSDISSVKDNEEMGVDVGRLQPASEQTNRRKKRNFPESGMTDFKNLPEPPQKVARTSAKKIESSGDKQLLDSVARASLNKIVPDSGVSPNIIDQSNAGKSVNTSSKDIATTSEEEGAEKSCQGPESGTRKRKSPASETEVDVMDIVSDPQISLLKERTDGSKKQDGVRTRIIMHREQNVTDAADSSLVGRIRQQMRDGADYTKGEVVEVSDDRFISAFKAAVARSRKKDMESKEAASRLGGSPRASKIQTRGVDAKRSRASLTRKLYAGGTGRWDRDWDITFWKERSARSNASKKEAGGEKSILQGSRVQSTKTDSVAENDSIFSRIFVADSSLFPRKEEVQPIVAPGGNLAACSLSDAKGRHSSHLPPAAVGLSKNAANVTDTEHNARIVGSTPKRETPRSVERNAVASGGKEQPSFRGSVKSGAALRQALKPCIAGESTSAATDVKKDKRQWALDVLARKTGTLGNGAGSAQRPSEPTNAGGQLTLMVQLPDDMRPLLPYDRNSKVPTAVRQVQLNRFIEQELKWSNLEIIQRSPDTEEAVHKAISREEEINKKANSKGVYVNLCVRALAQAEAEEQSNKATALDTLVHIAFQATGLIDTPPGSPHDKDVQDTSSMNCEAEARTLEVAAKLKESRPETLAEESQNLHNLNSGRSVPYTYDCQSKDKPNSEYSGTVSGIQSVSQHENAEVKRGKLTFVLSTVSTKDSEQSEAQRCPMRVDGKLGNGTNVEVSSPQADDEKEGKRVDDQHAIIHSSADHSATFSDECAPLEPSKVCLEQNLLSSKPLQERDRLETATEHSKKSSSDDTICASGGQVEITPERKIEEAAESPNRPEEHTMEDWMESGKFADLDRRIEDIRRKTSPSAAKDLDLPWSSSRAAGIPGEGDPLNSPFSVQKQVEIFVNQHLKPLYKSGVIKADQFRYTVSKTAAKVMEHHENAVSADFLIAEGAKVRKLADQYLQAFSKRKTK